MMPTRLSSAITCLPSSLKPLCSPLAARLAVVGVGELAVPVVRERQIARTAIVELLDPLDRRRGIAERVAVLDPDQRDLLAGLVDAPHVGGGERELDLVGCDLLGQQVDSVELGDRLLVGVVVAFRGERTLSHVHDEERRVEAARHHLRQVDLVAEVLRVVSFRREVASVDVVVRIERDDALMYPARLLDERVVCGRWGLRSWSGNRSQSERRLRSAAVKGRVIQILRRGS